MFTIFDYSSALEYSIIRRYTNIVYYYYFSITIRDLNCRMNSLLADFSYCNSDTIYMLFKSYCMNIYGSQVWKFYKKEVNICLYCMAKSNLPNI